VKEWVTQLRRGLMEFCLLNLLRGGESYGYEIVQRLQEIEELAVSESTVYPILARLREEGYLSVRTAPSPGAPPRRYFSLTRLGQSYVREMNDYWDGLTEAVDRTREGLTKRARKPGEPRSW
jgi:PadR family transcriptional regulator, regulatory protein PadR